MTGSRHPGDALQELLDGRLDDAQREVVERHLLECERCRRERAQLEWTRRTARGACAVEPAPDGLNERLTAALDAEDARRGGPGAAANRSRPVRWQPWAALAAAVLLVALYFWPSGEVDVPTRLAEDFAAYRQGTVTLEVVTSDFGEVERYLNRHLDFELQVYDLAMMEYLPVGGRVHDAAGVPSGFFVYRGPDGRILVCQMFRARLEALPAADERRHNDGIDFRVYDRDGKTVVAWQEGEVVCVLVSDVERDQVIQLAFAKAVKV